MTAGDWISAGSVVLAAISFIWGVHSWRSSFIGQKQIELVEQVYGLFLTCADHINAVRDPIGYSTEGLSRKQAEGETPEQTEIYNRAFVAIERLEARKEDLNTLFALQPRFELYFGEGAANPIRELQRFVYEIRRSSNRLRVHWLRQGQPFRSEEEFNRHLERMHADEAVFWDGFGDEDPIRNRLKSATETMAAFCQEAINPRRNVWKIGKGLLLRIERFFELPRNGD